MKRTVISLVFVCAFIILSGFIISDGWEVDPEQYYYGDVEFGDYKDKQFTVTAGWRYWGGGTVSVTGNDPTLFTCISGCTYTLDPDEQHTVTIRFTPPECPTQYAWHTNYSAEVEFPEHSGQVMIAQIAGSGTGDPAPHCQ